MKKIFLILILLIAVFFRFWDLNEMPPGLYPDEAMNGNNALEALHTGNFKFFYPENTGREGLFINIQAISVALFGNEPWALRGVSGVFGVITVLGVFYLALELFKNNQPQIQNSKFKIQNYNSKLKSLENNEVIALMASFFLATSFWHINFSRIGFRAIMAPAFLVWSLYFILLALNKITSFNLINNNEVKSQKSKFKSPSQNLKVMVGGFLYGLGFHSYIAYRATPVLILLVFIYFWLKNKESRRKIFISAVLFFAAAFVATSPLLLHFYQNPQDFLGRTSQISVFSSENPIKNLSLNTVKTLGMFWYQGDFNFRHNFAGEPQLFWPVGILFAIGIFTCLFWILNPKSKIQNPRQIQNPNFQNSKQINFSFKHLNFGHWDLFKNWKLEIRNLKSRNILPELLLLFWLVIGLLPVIISNEGIPHALRAIIILPPVMLISALAFYKIIFKVGGWLICQKEKLPELSRKITRIQKEALFLLFLFFMGLAVQSYLLYFMRYKTSPYISGAFSENYVKLGEYLNTLPKEKEKYVIVNASGTDVRGMPMPSQTVMFITKTFLPEWQKEKNLQYVLPQNLSQISCENSCVIIMLETDSGLRQKIKEKIYGLETAVKEDVIVLMK